MAPPFSTCNSAKRKSFVQKGSNMTIPANAMGKQLFRAWNLEFSSWNLRCFRKMQQKMFPCLCTFVYLYIVYVYAILQHYLKKQVCHFRFTQLVGHFSTVPPPRRGIHIGWGPSLKPRRWEFDAAWGIYIHSPPQEFQLCFHLFRLEKITGGNCWP